MKHLKTLLFPLFICSLFITSCKDTDKDPNPCDNAVTVMAADVSQYGFAHFVGDNIISSFAPSQVYYLAKNWNDYSSKVTPGKMYKLGFKEVPCDWCGTGCFGNTDSSAKTSRCGTPVYKCIEIICLTEIVNQPINDCFGVNLEHVDFDNYYSRATQLASITGHSLKTTAYFSGCSNQDPIQFSLALREIPTQNPGGPIAFDAKVEEVSNGYTCQAVFTKNACFDLAGLASYYLKNNINLPSDILIRFHYNDQVQELHYQPIK